MPSLLQIVGGSEAPKGAYPYIVSLELFNFHLCAGSILNSQWIITAGHCIEAASLFPLYVKAGKHDLLATESTEQTARVAKSIVHEKYNG